MRLILVPVSGTEAVTALALFPVGSRYEAGRQAGVSHFIEHMMFKGTERRPTALDLSRELDGVGAEYNAFTSRDHTGYFIKIDAAKTELALDFLSDILWHSKFNSEEMTREKGVILEELKMYQDNPTMHLGQLAEEAVFGSHPLGREIGGEARTVKSLTRENLVDYYRDFYQPNNLVLVLAGRLPRDVGRLVKKYFGLTPAARPRRQPFAACVTRQLRGRRVKIQFKDTKQVHLAIGFPAFAYDDKRLYPAALLNIILGAAMSSRLFTEVREKRGLAYAIHSGANPYQDTGNFLIEAGLDKERVPEAMRVILAELEKIKKEGIIAEELTRAKENFKGHLILSCESSSFQAEWYGKQALLMKKTETPQEKLKKLLTIRAAEVLKIARQIFNFSNLKLAVIGPYKNDSAVKRWLKL